MGRIRTTSRLQREHADHFLKAARFCSVAAAVGVGSAVAGVAGANAQAGAAQAGAQQQTQMAVYSAINQQANLNNVLALLRPFVDTGTRAFGQQGDLIGINGNAPQQAMIDNIRNSPLFQAQVQRGEQSILQNASATGGLRGGNTQAALAQFSPAMLSAEINNRFQQLGGLANIGQNAAVGVGNAGQAATNAISSQLAQIGAAQAGSSIAQGRATAQGYNAISSGLGLWAGARGGGGLGSTGLSSGYSGSTGYAPGADPLGTFINGL